MARYNPLLDADRGAIAAYPQHRFGVSLDPATQILPTSGFKEALFIDLFARLGVDAIGREATLDLWVKVPDGSGEGYIRLAMVPALADRKEAIAAWTGSRA